MFVLMGASLPLVLPNVLLFPRISQVFYFILVKSVLVTLSVGHINILMNAQYIIRVAIHMPSQCINV